MAMINGVDRENLRKLADYLLALPEGYRNFNMNHYAVDATETKGREPCEATTCGTIGCAAGHGPAAGITARARIILTLSRHSCVAGILSAEHVYG